MKKVGVLGAVIGLVLAVNWASGQEIKIGVVDMNGVFSAYYKVAETQKEFDSLRKERQASVEKKADEMQNEIQPLQDKLDKQQSDLKEKEKVLSKEKTEEMKAEISKLGDEIEKKRNEVLRFQREAYQELQSKNREMVESRVKEINEVIARIGKEKGYTVIIHKEAVLYSLDAADLTDEVLKILNKEAPKSAEPKAKGESKKR